MASNGPRQAILLSRARQGVLLLDGSERERSAARRLVARGILQRYRFGSSHLGYLAVYRVVGK